MEVLISRQLVHPNILPLLGVSKSTPLSLVTPWQHKGSARQYILALRKNGGAKRSDYHRIVSNPRSNTSRLLQWADPFSA